MSFIAFAAKRNKNKLFFSDLPFGHIATYFGLIKLPKMPELNKRKVEGFTPLKMDWNTIKYK